MFSVSTGDLALSTEHGISKKVRNSCVRDDGFYCPLLRCCSTLPKIRIACNVPGTHELAGLSSEAASAAEEEEGKLGGSPKGLKPWVLVLNETASR